MSGEHAEPEFEYSHQQQPNHDEAQKPKQPEIPPPTLAEQEARAANLPDLVQQALTRKSGSPAAARPKQEDLATLSESETQNATAIGTADWAQAALTRAGEQKGRTQELDIDKLKRRIVSLGESATREYSAAQAALAVGNQPQHHEHLETAITYLQLCTTFIEQVLAEIAVPARREAYFSGVRQYYQVQIQVLMALHQADSTAGYDVQAFEVSEGSRARLHNEQLVRAGSGINIRQGAHPALLAREQELLNKNRRTAEEAAELKGIRERMESEAYQDIDYYDPLKLAEIQNEVLDEETALIYYSVHSDKVFVWVVTQESFFTCELVTNESELQKLMEERLEYFRDISSQAPQRAEEEERESLLGEALIQPVLDEIQAQNCSRIVIAAEGALKNLPFSTLIIRNNVNHENYLVEDYEIVYISSSTSIAISREQAEAQVTELDPDALGIFALGNFSGQPVLPFAPIEAATIQHYNSDNTNLYIGDEATEENFIDATATYTILHVATHGQWRPRYSWGSGLILRDDSGQDDMLTQREIPATTISMSTQLLVLSACDTAAGGSEESVSIAHTFTRNGIPRVIGTLWKVSDAGTMRFMEFFYEALFENNQSPSAALQHAQKKMIALTRDSANATVEHPHPEGRDVPINNDPFFWAAFKLVGDWQWPPRF
ncbi:MAG: CHAT domain-containing protein [Cyanobacteria bacterium P01_G01_bin.54]